MARGSNGTELIDTREATVRTLSASVQALRIGTKQVTLSVFRQLPRVQVIDPETLQLRGVPWGRVNYFPSDCEVAGKGHLHVVWQKGDGLCRACVEREAGDPGPARDLLNGW